MGLLPPGPACITPELPVSIPPRVDEIHEPGIGDRRFCHVKGFDGYLKRPFFIIEDKRCFFMWTLEKTRLPEWLHHPARPRHLHLPV